MMRLLTPEDFRDIYIKIIQRGWPFLLSKLALSADRRTKSSFNAPELESSHWWMIPLVRKHWNALITGNPDTTYEEMLSKEMFPNARLKVVSIGSGTCSHELMLARLNPEWKISCIDFSEKLLEEAQSIASHEQLTNIDFIAQDIRTLKLQDQCYDMVLFHASLHHFSNMEEFVLKIKRSLKPEGVLVINEYVGKNRLQYSKQQIKAINDCLDLIPEKFKKIYKTRLVKSKYYGSGWLRMVIADPSECIESERILPVIHKHFTTRLERGYGGNLLMPVLKDISHHFVDPISEKQQCLELLFAREDHYLKSNTSDFVFGIYEKRNYDETTTSNK